MKNLLKKNLFFYILLSLLHSPFPLIAQQQEDPLAQVAVPLKVTDAIYGRLDNQIRSGENVHLINKRTKVALSVQKDKWAYLTDGYRPLLEFVFTIEKVAGKDGDIINDGDNIRLKTLATFAEDTPYLGVEQRAGWALGLGAKKVWFAHLSSKKSDPTCQWQISGKVIAGGEIKLKSLKSEKFIYDSASAEKKAPANGKGKHNRSSFIINHVLEPPVARQQLVIRQVQGIGLATYLEGQIKEKTGIKNISQGIVLEGEFNELLSDLGLRPPSKIWKQLTVTYELGRTKCPPRTFLETSKKIQIPTQEELLDAKKIIKTRQEASKDLAELGFSQTPGRLIKIATEAGLTLGINSDGTLYLLQDTFKEIGPVKFLDIAIGTDSTVILIGTDKKLYTLQTKEGKFTPTIVSESPIFADVSLVNKDDIWVITTDGKIQKLNMQTKQLTPVAGVTLSQISAGPGKVMGITATGDLYEWIGGTSYDNPQGWIKIPSEKLKQIEVGKEIWGVEFEGRKVLRLVRNRWEEVGPLRHFAYVTISSTGTIFGLVPEFPLVQGGHAIYGKTTTLRTFNSQFALKTFYHKYLSVGPGGTLSAATSWPESFTLVNPQNEISRGSLAFGQNVALKSLATGNYVKVSKDQTGKTFVLANEPNLANATIFTLINQLNPQDTSELEIGLDTPINLETSNGLQLGATKSTGNVFVDNQKGTLEKKWRIE